MKLFLLALTSTGLLASLPYCQGIPGHLSENTPKASAAPALQVHAASAAIHLENLSWNDSAWLGNRKGIRHKTVSVNHPARIGLGADRRTK